MTEESLGRYRVLETLGKGGMGEVFLADDTQLGRKVAIKFLTEALENDPTARERLHREARSAAALDHPYICKIFEIAEIDGRTGIVMEHVSGETLQARMRRSPLGAVDALAIAGEIAEALDEAHRRRISGALAPRATTGGFSVERNARVKIRPAGSPYLILVSILVLCKTW